MTKLSLTFACESYDRIRALQDERVRPEGIDLNIVALPVEETFYRQARYREFDVSEMSLSSYLLRSTWTSRRSWRCPCSRHGCSGTSPST